MLDPLFFESVLQQTGRQLHSLTFYFQGEPYLNPAFTDLVKKAAKRNIFTITSTNAHYLSTENAIQTVDSGLDKLIISIDGSNQESYARYRIGGDFEKVLAGTKEIIKQKKRMRSRVPHVVWQFVVFRHNENQIDEIKKMAKEMGVDEVAIKTAQVYDYEKGNDLIPETGKYARYFKNAAGKYQLKNKLLNQCWRMWQSCVITWDGRMVPCCFDKDASHQVGDLRTQSFQEAWHSPEYQSFRQAVLISRKEIDICANCSEGTTIFTD
jgi:radical SAM protein with 4Fe4S-binding SPASM domain